MSSHIKRSTRKKVARAIHDVRDHRPGAAVGQLSGAKGVMAGAGAAVLLPLAIRGASKLNNGLPHPSDHLPHPSDLLHDARGLIADSSGGRIAGAVAQRGDGAASMLGELFSSTEDDGVGIIERVLGGLHLGQDDDDEHDDEQQEPPAGVGKGRRMPVQQCVDIGAPIAQVYDHWVRYEDWPSYMHRVTSVTQEDKATVRFAVKIWGRTREFSAKIETQRPRELVKWRVTQGMSHTGVVTFHELGPNLTRVLLGMDVEPGGLIEKLARGLRYVKRAARGDLHRFKALVEMAAAAEEDVDAWSGTIEEGKVVNSSSSQSSRSRSTGSSARSKNGHNPRSGASQSGSSSARSRRQPSGRDGHGR
jgi:uncharacterized membrane protein